MFAHTLDGPSPPDYSCMSSVEKAIAKEDRASLGPLFEILEDVCWTGLSCGIPRENNGTFPNRCWVLLMV